MMAPRNSILGQQVVAYLAIIILWITSYNQVLSEWLDVLGVSFREKSTRDLVVAVYKVLLPASYVLGSEQMGATMHLARMDVLTEALPPGFWVNRGELLLAAILLVWMTIGAVEWRRQRHM
jgi:hypothetical protein